MNLTKLNRRIVVVRETIDLITKKSMVKQRRKRIRLLLSPSVQQQIVGGLMSVVSIMEVVL